MKSLVIVLIAAPLLAQHATAPRTATAKPAVAVRNPFAGNPREAEAGRGMFRIYCAPCHGIHGKGGEAPDLTRGSWSVGNTDAALLKVISEGSPGTEMPGYTGRLERDQIWRIVTFLRASAVAKPEQPRGDAKRGLALYAKSGCANCHAIQNTGGRLGPDLTQIGRGRNLAHLRESIVNPSADLAKGHSGMIVVTNAGETIRGVSHGSDFHSVRLSDMSGRYHSFLRSELRSAVEMKESLMPSYDKRLTPAEADDLVAYLYTLGKEKATR